jgi:phosphorylcholine metabolism protein LicD
MHVIIIKLTHYFAKISNEYNFQYRLPSVHVFGEVKSSMIDFFKYDYYTNALQMETLWVQK